TPTLHAEAPEEDGDRLPPLARTETGFVEGRIKPGVGGEEDRRARHPRFSSSQRVEHRLRPHKTTRQVFPTAPGRFEGSGCRDRSSLVFWPISGRAARTGAVNRR